MYKMGGLNMDAGDVYDRSWIIENSKKILEEYTGGITVRQLHYRLVAIGMINDMNHYKRVVTAMTKARWDDIVDMESFIDRERSMYGETADDDKDLDDEIENGKDQVKAWMNAYRLNRWSNQKNYVEVWIEKKALQGVFERPCLHKNVGLAPCKGYPSITFLNEASKRFEDAVDNGKKVILLYFGDYDPSGADIPRSIQENLWRMGIEVEVKRIALNSDQIKEMNLPGVPPKVTDSRTANWSGGDVVECDAIEPKTLTRMCEEAIEKHFDRDLYSELKEKEKAEREQYKQALKDFVSDLGEEED
jgi:hypothetical protein